MSESPDSTTTTAATTVERWRDAVKAGDLDAAFARLSPDVVLTSPLTDQFHLEGAEQVRDFVRCRPSPP